MNFGARLRRIRDAAPPYWLLEVPRTLSDQQVSLICDWAHRHQRSRWLGMPAGDEREELGRALQELRAHQVTQRVVGDRWDSRGDIRVFEAPKLEHERLISIPGDP